mmetsp:Transcript_27790/g.69400  ORF Transcript_27790/g.69400 Transcript_27790/m.69400 type:complete len:86 (-) Transcript_27790:89-346(-)
MLTHAKCATTQTHQTVSDRHTHTHTHTRVCVSVPESTVCKASSQSSTQSTDGLFLSLGKPAIRQIKGPRKGRIHRFSKHSTKATH